MNARLRLCVTEISIRMSRIYATKVSYSVVYVDTSKMKLLGVSFYVIMITNEIHLEDL
jgi:hypothetical protein